MKPQHLALAALLLRGGLLLPGCEEPPPEADDDDATEQDPSIHDRRYCEVILLVIDAGTVDAEVWNSLGLGDCPDAAWEALDTVALAEEAGVSLVVLNGPRHFLMDRIETLGEVSDEVRDFGGISMRIGATFSAPIAGLADTPWTEREIVRDTLFVFDAGREVYQLTDPDGRLFTMQSYSLAEDPSLSVGDLAPLGGQLEHPEGWSFEASTLDAELVVASGGLAIVVQDELKNTYQLSE